MARRAERLLVLKIVFIWSYLIIQLNFINWQLYPSWTGVVIVVSMAATWLFAVVLVRIPTTRRICLNDARALSQLCWLFCVLWVAALWYHDGETTETWSAFLRRIVMQFGVTWLWALEFMVMLSFWGNLRWKHPIRMVWSLVKGRSKRVSNDLIPSENNLEFLAYFSLSSEDPQLSDSQLDEKPSQLKV